MTAVPMLFQMSGRQVVIAGGGERAAQTIRALQQTGARLVLLAQQPCAEIRALTASGQIWQKDCPVTAADFTGAALVFIATGCPAADHALYTLARAAGAVVCVADQPELCDVIFPAEASHEPMKAAPAVPQIARPVKRATGPGSRAEAAVALVGAGPGAGDLITLRGAQRLQNADVIFYDRLVDPKVLDLARPNAMRVYVGKAPGYHSWPQEKITRAIVEAARAGKRVVRLKCGDPGIFARSCEETEALQLADIAYEIVPGVTAACGAAAAIGAPLTERNAIDTLILTTGHLSGGQTVPDAIRNMRPGSCVALYMAVSAAGDISRYMAANLPVGEIGVTVVCNAQAEDEKTLVCNALSLPAALARAGVKNTAMIILKWRAGTGGAAMAAQDWARIATLPDLRCSQPV